MDNAAPNPAPELTPSIPELTRGFLKRPWKAAPLTAREPPTRAPRIALGSRISQITLNCMSGIVSEYDNKPENKVLRTLINDNGYLPTQSDIKIHINGAIKNRIYEIFLKIFVICIFVKENNEGESIWEDPNMVKF